MRQKMIAIAALSMVVMVAGGCLHVGREADLVSKLGLEHTVRIAVGAWGRRDWNPAAFEVTDPDLIKDILSDLTMAVGVRSRKYETVAAATFIGDKGEELRLEIYGKRDGMIVRADGRFYELQGKLVEMIRNWRKSSWFGDLPLTVGRPRPLWGLAQNRPSSQAYLSALTFSARNRSAFIEELGQK